MTIGSKINALRTRCGMSQGALAEKVGVSRQSISKWESGQTAPETEKIVLLAQIFSLSPDDLTSECEINFGNTEAKEVEEETDEEVTQRMNTNIIPVISAPPYPPLNTLKKASIIFLQLMVAASIFTAIFDAWLFALQTFISGAENPVFVLPPFTLVKIVAECAMGIAFSVTLYRNVRDGKSKLNMLIAMLIVINIFSLLPVTYLDQFFMNGDEQKITSFSYLNANFSYVNYFYALGVMCFDVGAAFAFALKLSSPSAYEIEKPMEKETVGAGTIISGLIVGLLGTPIAWTISFVVLFKQKAKRPVFTNTFIRYQVVGMIAEVIVAVMVVAAVYIVSSFAK